MNFFSPRSDEREKHRISWQGGKRFAGGVLVMLILAQTSCGVSQKAATPAGRQNTATIPLQVTDTAVVMPSAPATDGPAMNLPADEVTDSLLLRQGAFWGYLDPYMADEVAVGDYDAKAPSCGNGWLATLPKESGETILTLEYLTPVLPEQLIIYAAGAQTGIRRIEMLNSQSGLGVELDLGYLASGSTPLHEGACDTRINIPAHSEFEVDQIIMAFEDNTFAASIAAVELYGRLAAFTEPSVYWRVPLPGTPADIAMGPNGLVYVATQGNGLYGYDVEGNLLKKFDIPEHADILKLAVDPFGNLALTDAAYRWFVVLSPEGVQQTAGGDGLYTGIAVNPQTGNIYLMDNNTIEVYTSDTAESVDQFRLDDTHVYTSMTFNSQGNFYLLRDFNWDAAIITADPLTGEEQDAFPLEQSHIVETVANDLVTDEDGNIYVLFSMNTGQIAIHQFSQNGVLLQRFGKLTSDVNDWAEGSFLDPRALAVSPDGRFVLVADGYDDQAYLTCFLMEIDE